MFHPPGPEFPDGRIRVLPFAMSPPLPSGRQHPLRVFASEELAPVFVTSPSIRCGTTLVQRLLCASGRALIYGENAAQELEVSLGLLVARVLIHSARRGPLAELRARVLAGEGDHWMTDLLPDLDGYLAAQAQGVLAALDFCRRDALAAGRPVWGMKYPGWPPPALETLRAVLPRARWVYMVRPLANCLRSAMARGSVNNPAEAAAFCHAWAGNLQYALATFADDPRALLVSFDALTTGNPGLALARLAAFCGLEALDAAPLSRRINARDFNAADPGAGDYQPPAELSADETRLVAACEAPFSERLAALV